MSDDYFSYQANKLKPKPSHQRPAPARDALKRLGQNERVAEKRGADDGMIVEESTASDSMIVRIIGKIRGQ